MDVAEYAAMPVAGRASALAFSARAVMETTLGGVEQLAQVSDEPSAVSDRQI